MNIQYREEPLADAGRSMIGSVLVVTDAWTPQTNGVVTTLQAVIARLERLGVRVTVIQPGLFRSVPLPGYREIPLVVDLWRVGRLLAGVEADTVHIATEGPLGMAARSWMCRRGLPFTTSLHTKFPEYFNERLGTPPAFGYRILRWFHAPAVRTLVTTGSHRDELLEWGLSDLEVWGRGVDTSVFLPMDERPLRGRPRLLYVGRVSVEKNIEDFLRLDFPAEKVVVGDGPARADLERRYPEVQWLGFRRGAELVREYAAADAFVFPSRTDTFGLVMLEANACGTPVAAYPVTGPKDVVIEGVNGSLDQDLRQAVRSALQVSRASCRSHALDNDWERIALRFLRAMEPIRGSERTLQPDGQPLRMVRHGAGGL
jgi:glycosyltransferase involved in cell wall biosynthesis